MRLVKRLHVWMRNCTAAAHPTTKAFLESSDMKMLPCAKIERRQAPPVGQGGSRGTAPPHSGRAAGWGDGWPGRLLLIAGLVCMVLGGMAPDLRAQSEEPAEEKIVERTIYVPFAKLREVFEREGRGVFLPYEEFEELWKAAQAASQTPPAMGPLVDNMIVAASNEATVEQDVIRVSATLTIELLKSGWNQVPLRLQDAAILSASIDGSPARIIAQADGSYQLLIQNESQQAQRIELLLDYAKAFTKTPGKNSVQFSAPQAPVNRWRIRIPQAGVKVNIDPMIAASESPSLETDASPAAERTAETEDEEAASRPPDTEAAGVDETVLLAFVGAAPQISIDWTPKAEGATGLDALVSVEALQEVYLSEGATRTRTQLKYDISRSQVAQLNVDVPADYKVVNVFDPNVRKWDVTVEGAMQHIQVELFEPATEQQLLLLELEKYNENQTNEEWQAPQVRALDVARQQGVVVVQVDNSLRAEATTRSGLLQLDVSELPPSLTDGNWAFAYRYAALPMELRLNLEKVQPRITLEQLVEYVVEPEQVTLGVTVVYNIEQAGVFQFSIAVPAGYEVRRVQGLEIVGANAAAVAGFQTSGDDQPVLVVNLSRKAIGKVGLYVHLQRRLADPNLLAPTGVSSSLPLVVPTAQQEFVSQATGKLVVYAPESLRMSPTPTGLRPIAISEAFTSLPPSGSGSAAGGRAVVAYEFSEQAATLDLSLERRKPYVTARQRLLVGVEEGVVRYECLIMVNVLYSGVKSLRVDVPADLAADIRNVSGGLRDAPMEPVPDDAAPGYVAWEFTADSELLGNHTIRLSWESKIDELEVGSSLTIAVPRIQPMATDRAWGQIVITKSESLDVEPTGTPEGLRPIDPLQDVMPEARVRNAARAFEFYEDWQLELTATRYELEEVKRTSIERAVVRTVITRSGMHNVHASYRIRSARQRLTLKLPEGVEFDTQPARINGSPVSLERGDQELLTIPLVGQNANAPFVLDLRYSLEGDARRIALPEFPEEPAVQKVYLAVFLPDEVSLLHSGGPWTEEFEWEWDALRTKPVSKLSDDALVNWVGEGITVSAGPMFQKDGLMYLFSALRPAPSPDGALCLWTMRQTSLSGLVVVVLAVIGLLLLRSELVSKLVVIMLALILAVGCGTFAPALGQQLVGVPMIAGLLIVGILWSTWHAARTVRMVDWQHVFTPRSDPPTVAATASAEQAATAPPPASGQEGDSAPPPSESETDQGGRNE